MCSTIYSTVDSDWPGDTKQPQSISGDLIKYDRRTIYYKTKFKETIPIKSTAAYTLKPSYENQSFCPSRLGRTWFAFNKMYQYIWLLCWCYHKSHGTQLHNRYFYDISGKEYPNMW